MKNKNRKNKSLDFIEAFRKFRLFVCSGVFLMRVVNVERRK
jgi:hypothetical protein